MKPPLELTIDTNAKRLTLVFPSRVVSTNADEMKQYLDKRLSALQAPESHWEQLQLNFCSTEFIDSIGLNLVFALVAYAEARKASIEATITSRAVRLILYTVRLDKRMAIKLIEPENKSEKKSDGTQKKEKAKES
jgi:anti-anti-sigma regulatory factor